VDVVATHHRAAPPTQQFRAVLWLLDREKEDGGLGVVVSSSRSESSEEDESKRSTSANSAVEFIFDSVGVVGGGPWRCRRSHRRDAGQHKGAPLRRIQPNRATAVDEEEWQRAKVGRG
jgi:hypothetical protein